MGFIQRGVLVASLLLALGVSVAGDSPSAAAQPGDFRFAPFIPFVPGHHYCGTTDCWANYAMEGVWIGDLTGDGRDDLLTSPETNEIWVIPQLPDGSLALEDPRVYAYGDNVYRHEKHFALGDFNEDGALDMVGNYSGYGLGMNVLLSDGEGGHVLHRRESPESYHNDWRYPFAEDVDGDGHLDVLFFTGHGDINTQPPREGVTYAVIQYGDGTGDFPRYERTLLAGKQSLDVELADLDGDGHRDVAMQVLVGFPGDDTLAVSYHDGRSGFAPAVVTDVPFPTGAAFADWDGDEQMEMSVASGGILHAVSVPAPADVSVAPMVPVAYIHPALVLGADLDRDGRPDLYTQQFYCDRFCSRRYLAPYLHLADGWQALPVLTTDEPDVPHNVTNHYHAYAAGDVNGDGCTDVVTSHNQDGIAIFHGTNCMAPARPARDDFDGDGASDILWRHAGDGSDVIWLSGRSGDRQRMRAVRNTDWDIVATGDFDGDDVSDLFWRNRDTGANAIWPGAAPARTPVRWVTGAGWAVAGSGDFDGDGSDDIFWRNSRTGTNAVWPGGHPGDFKVTAVRNADWVVATIGDFDGDRIDDVFWRNVTTGENVVWRAADYRDQWMAGAVEGQAWRVAGSGDFDGDRRDDVFWRNSQTGANVIWNGAKDSAQIPMADVANTAWFVARIADYTGDGLADLLWRNRTQGTNVIWRAARAGNRRTVGRATDPEWTVAPNTP